MERAGARLEEPLEAVVVPLAALLLLGPPTISTFTLALLLGILAGTYSSIFNASPILVEWDARAAARKAR